MCRVHRNSTSFPRIPISLVMVLLRERAPLGSLESPKGLTQYLRQQQRAAVTDISLPWTNARTASDLRQIAALEPYVMGSIGLTIETKVDPN